MFSNFKFEKALAALVILTLGAVIAERNIIKSKTVIETNQGFEVSVYDDGGVGGGSRSELIDAENFEWRCELREGSRFPYCGFEILFNPDRQNGLDLSGYDQVKIWLDYKGPGESVRFYLRNFDPLYSKPGDNSSTKYNQVEFSTELLDRPVELALDDFFVANWWIQARKVPPKLSHPQFNNVVVFEVQTGNGAPLGTHEFKLNRLEFTGSGTSTQLWYQVILAVWLGAAILYLSGRVLFQGQELKKRRQRERELEEINVLLDTRGKELEEMTKKDALTGAFNRQGVEEAMTLGLAESRRANKPLSIIILDVDFFKKINDQHGHAVGDRILMGLSELVQGNIRSEDQFARWGGEEFVLVCRNTPVEQAFQLADKLRQLIANYQFEDDLQVTASLGVASLASWESLDQLFVRADEALYEAKASGRNCVKMAKESFGS